MVGGTETTLLRDRPTIRSIQSQPQAKEQLVRFLKYFVASLALIGLANESRADFLAFQLPNGTAAAGNVASNTTFGQEFSVNSSITITQLGFFDTQVSSFVGSFSISIYDANTQTLIPGTTVTLTSAGTYQLGFRYVTLTTPATFGTGSHLTVVAENRVGSATTNYGPSTTNDTGGGLITYPASGYRYDFSPGYPQNTAPENIFGTTSFIFAATVVPEPTSVVLMGLGVTGVLGFGLRSRKRMLAGR